MQMIQSDDSVVLVWFFLCMNLCQGKKNISCICSKNVFFGFVFFSCISKPQKITFKSAIWVWTNVFKKSLSLWECRLSLAVFNQVKFRDGSSCCVVFSSRWNWCSQAVSWMTQGLMCCLFPHLLQWQGTQGCHTDTSCLWYCWRLDAAMICNSGLWPFFLSASAWLVCLTPCSLFPFVLLRHEQRVCAGLQPNEWTSPQRTQRSLMWSQVRLLFLLLCTNFYSYFFTLQQFSLSNEQVYEVMAVFSWNIS